MAYNYGSNSCKDILYLNVDTCFCTADTEMSKNICMTIAKY